MNSNPYIPPSDENLIEPPQGVRPSAQLWRPSLVLALSPVFAILLYRTSLSWAMDWADVEFRRAVSRGLSVTEDERAPQLELDMLMAYSALPYIFAIFVAGALLSATLKTKGLKRYALGIAVATVPLIGAVVYILSYSLAAR